MYFNSPYPICRSSGRRCCTELGDWLRRGAHPSPACSYSGLGALVLRATPEHGNLHWSWGPLVIVVVTVVHRAAR